MEYFQEKESIEILNEIIKNEPRMQPGDLLSINVSGIDGKAALPFNIFETPISGDNVAAGSTPINYLVNSKGEIQFPVIGNINVLGETNISLTEKIKVLLKDHLINPTVVIRIVNFKVTVLGEVKNPGTFTVSNERITILEAIGMAGDLTIQGKRTTISLLKEVNGKKTFIPIDITNKDLVNSPYYYLGQNDVIYVAPNKAKINSSVVGTNTSIIFASISTLVSIIAILTK